MKSDHDDRERAAYPSEGKRPDWAHRLAHRLIRHAAHQAPPALSHRLEEEWLADLGDRRRTGSRLRFAVGCCWASRVIASEWLAAAAPAAVPTAERSLVNVPCPDGAVFLPRRAGVLLIIVGLHVALIYGLAHGLGRVVKDAIVSPMTGSIVELPRHPHELPPPPPIPTLAWKPRLLVLPAPNVPLENIASVEDPTPGVAPPREPPQPAEPIPAPVIRVPGGPGEGFPHADDFYPPSAVRAGQAGSATVNVCVDRSGRLSAAPSVVHSSGFASLDAAALKLARAGSGRYRPTAENGQPITSCYPFRITFSLKH